VIADIVSMPTPARSAKEGRGINMAHPKVIQVWDKGVRIVKRKILVKLNAIGRRRDLKRRIH
jgi:hypothetical protein